MSRSRTSEQLDSQESTSSESMEEDPNSRVNKNKRKLTSAIHSHFTLTSDGVYYQCNYCSSTKYKKGGGVTSTMTLHMKNKHSSKWTQDDVDESTSIKRFLVAEGGAPLPILTNESFRKLLCEFVLLTDQPFRIVEEISFRNLIHLLNSEVSIPSRTTIRSDVSTMYKTEKEVLKKKLQDFPGKLSFIVDCWTSSNQWAFQGIIVQGITKDWTIFTAPLDLTILEGSHTGENLAKSFFNVIVDFGLQDRIHCITTDNASNMDTFFEHLEKLLADAGHPFDSENFRIRCLAHILNLSCQDALNHLRNENDDESEDDEADILDYPAISKLRKAIVFLRGSPQRREQFRNQCSAWKMSPHELILDVRTRWNSSLDMLQTSLTYRKPIECALRSEKNLMKWILSEEEWIAIELMISFLKPFKDMTVLMSKQSFPTVSFCGLVYSQVFQHLEKYVVNEGRKLKGIDPVTQKLYPGWLRSAATDAYEKLDKYYPSSDGLAYVVATILDPRCKIEWFKLAGFSDQIISGYRSQIKALWNNSYKPSINQSGSESIARDSEIDLFMQMYRQKKTDKGKDELARYLSETTVRPDALQDGSLGYWKVHCSEYIHLSKMARDFLSASGTGVPVERLFSFGPDLLSPRRQRMKPETIRECICTKGWLKARAPEEFLKRFCICVSEKMLGEI